MANHAFTFVAPGKGEEALLPGGGKRGKRPTVKGNSQVGLPPAFSGFKVGPEAVQAFAQGPAPFTGLFMLSAVDAPAGTPGKRDEYRNEFLPWITWFRMSETGCKQNYTFLLSMEINSVLAKK